MSLSRAEQVKLQALRAWADGLKECVKDGTLSDEERQGFADDLRLTEQMIEELTW
jgi:hypothetical protein